MITWSNVSLSKIDFRLGSFQRVFNVADGKVRGKGPLALSNSVYIKLLLTEACVIIDSLSSNNNWNPKQIPII